MQDLYLMWPMLGSWFYFSMYIQHTNYSWFGIYKTEGDSLRVHFVQSFIRMQWVCLPFAVSPSQFLPFLQHAAPQKEKKHNKPSQKNKPKNPKTKNKTHGTPQTGKDAKSWVPSFFIVCCFFRFLLLVSCFFFLFVVSFEGFAKIKTNGKTKPFATSPNFGFANLFLVVFCLLWAWGIQKDFNRYSKEFQSNSKQIHKVFFLNGI